MNKKWYNMKYETREWKSSIDLQYISRRSKSKILPTYQSSLPDTIFEKNIKLSPEFEVAISDLLVNLSRFDAHQKQKGYAFPSMLLRSESAASSQIEKLTSSIRNIALAELSHKAPQNAQLIASNVQAMRTALKLEDTLSVSLILEVHRTLMKTTQNDQAGVFRDQAVWIGGTDYSPHDALFVPPHQDHIDFYLEDLISYSKRIDVNPIVKAAIIHAQFETIHPFIDGNGRTGRTLLHKTLKDDGVLQNVTLPLSAGLLNHTNEYMNAILSFQNGNPLPIIEQVFNAIELAMSIGHQLSEAVSQVIKRWENLIEERKNASIWKLLYLLIEQPVIDSKYLSTHLQITRRAATNLINSAVNYGILRRIGTERRGVFYQSDELIEIMNMISDVESIRRNFRV